jgi:phosphomannomutase
VDPDADRLALTGPDGQPLGEERTLALAARQVLRSGAGPVVTNLSTSRMLDDVAEEAGVRLFRTPVGEINVAEMMETTRAVIGGEGNGGVIHPDVVLGRDALAGSALILSALAAAGGDVDVLVAAIPAYAMLKRKYDLPEGGADAFRERLSRSAGALGSAASDLRDGLRLEWPDRWVHLRPSNTEPVARLIVEAPSPEEAAGLADQAAAHFALDAGDGR